MPTTLIKKYEVDKASQDPIALTITIGYGQLGSTALTVAKKPWLEKAVNAQGVEISPDHNGNYPGSFTVTIGANNSLVDEELVVVSSIARIQKNEERSSLSVALKGGPLPKSYSPLEEKISKKGDWLTYVAIITFKAKT